MFHFLFACCLAMAALVIMLWVIERRRPAGRRSRPRIGAGPAGERLCGRCERAPDCPYAEPGGLQAGGAGPA